MTHSAGARKRGLALPAALYNVGMASLPRRFAAAALVFSLAAAIGLSGQAETPPFAALVARLSEPPGYFDTDNLISNEKSYLQVVPALREAGLTGGAYVGVGPDQNFSYIAQVRPAIAFIVDIRRDNLLLHLLFKAVFQLSTTRAGYLSLLLGRPVPGDTDEWRQADIERLVAHAEGAPLPPSAIAALRARVDATVAAFRVPLTAEDVATIGRFHRTFIERGLSLKFESTGRTPRAYYPTYRELLLETDRTGRRWSFLASEDGFQFVRSLQRRDLVVPVTGNLAGPSALARIGVLMRERGDRLSAIYTSNVEFYLSRGDGFDRFIGNLSRLPRSDKSLIIRSIFPGGSGPVAAAPGYFSASVVQRVDDLMEGVASGRFRSYRDVVRDR
jgi:hypothetical protein